MRLKKTQTMTLLMGITAGLLFLSAGCVSNEIQDPPTTKISQAAPTQDPKANFKKTVSEYREFLKANNCEAQYWSRYEFGWYFQRIATPNKITPFDLIFGDAYKTRNIDKAVLREANKNYFTYLNQQMPDPIREMFFTASGGELDEIFAQKIDPKSVFNTSVRRDYECYVKLK